MLCENCQQPIVPSDDGITVCGNCGRVNMTQDLKNSLFGGQAPPADTQKVALPKQGFLVRHLILATSLTMISLALAGLTLAALTQNIQGRQKLDSAIAADKAGNYQKAATLLKSNNSLFLSSSIKGQVKSEVAKNQKWQQDANYQKQAEALIAQQKYPEAIATLAKISSDFPTYKDINSLNQKAKTSQQTLDQQKAAAAQKAVTQPVQKTPTQTRAQSQQNTTPVKLPDTAPVNNAPSYTASPIGPNNSGGGTYYYVGASQRASARGASVVMSQVKPSTPQNGAQNHSLMELAVQSSDGRQIVEVGWIVDNILNGDTNPHLFVYHWIDGTPTCYNSCGFTQVSSTNTPGETVSAGTSGTYEISFSAGRWNIYYNSDLVGYYDASEWGGSYTQAGLIQVFGEVYIGSSSTTQCVQMGNGLAGSAAGSAQIKNFSLIGSSAAASLSAYYTSPSTYSAGSVSLSGLNLGGPGSC